VRYLAKRDDRLRTLGYTSANAEKQWESARQTQKVLMAFEVLARMNRGRRRCMYCEHDRAGTIDHFRPKSRHPEGTFAWTNWNLACGECNTHKREKFSELLLDPTRPMYRFEDHFELERLTGDFELRTDEGRESAAIYRLNEEEIVRGRMNAFVLYQALIAQYHIDKRAGRPGAMNAVAQTARTADYPSVLATILRWWRSPAQRMLLHPATAAAIQANPKVLSWV
jgi:hypothetical protein